MTVAVNNNPQQYTGTGANTALSTEFLFFTATDVVVTQRVEDTGVDTILVVDTHYTITGGSAAGATGTVTPIDGATDFPNTVVWTIERALPLTQATDYVENDSFPAASHEAALDRVTLIAQDDDVKSTRSLRFPTTDLSSLTSLLPNSVDRASKALTFDSSGNATVSTQTTTGFAKVVLDSDLSFSGTTLQLTSTEWTATYDRLELEVIRMQPSVNGTLQFEPIDNGTAVSTNLVANRVRILGGVEALTTGTNWDLVSGDNGLSDQVVGSMEIRHFSGLLAGQGHFTFASGATFGMLDIGVHRHTTVGTRWDGIEITHSGGTFAGAFRLWGIPKV